MDKGFLKGGVGGGPTFGKNSQIISFFFLRAYLTIFVTKTTNLFEVILLTRLMVTRLSTNSVMVRERVAQLPGQAVEACHQAQDRLSLAEERPNTTGSSLAAGEKHSDKHTSLSLLPESQDCL